MTKLKMAQLAAGLAFAALVAGKAGAQESNSTAGETSLKADAVKKGVKQKDIDEEITNARMRANSGSKSKYSMSVTFGYTGGSLEDPFGEKRPNLGGDPAKLTKTSAGGSISARYRMSQHDSLTFGTGYRIYTPFQGDTITKKERASGLEPTSIDNPSLGYSHYTKWGDYQVSASTSITAATSEQLKDVYEFDGFWGASLTGLTTLKSMPLTMGLSLAYSRAFMQSGPDEKFEGATKDARRDWDIGLYPFAEYQFNDTFAFRTVFGYFNFYHEYGNSEEMAIWKDNNYQSVGLSTSITRDIYLYPNIQFIPDDADLKKTNVAISATINMF